MAALQTSSKCSQPQWLLRFFVGLRLAIEHYLPSLRRLLFEKKSLASYRGQAG